MVVFGSYRRIFSAESARNLRGERGGKLRELLRPRRLLVKCISLKIRATSSSILIFFSVIFCLLSHFSKLFIELVFGPRCLSQIAAVPSLALHSCRRSHDLAFPIPWLPKRRNLLHVSVYNQNNDTAGQTLQ